MTVQPIGISSEFSIAVPDGGALLATMDVDGDLTFALGGAAAPQAPAAIHVTMAAQVPVQIVVPHLLDGRDWQVSVDPPSAATETIVCVSLPPDR